jgi:hypothetical protein
MHNSHMSVVDLDIYNLISWLWHVKQRHSDVQGDHEAACSLKQQYWPFLEGDYINSKKRAFTHMNDPIEEHSFLVREHQSKS